MLENLKNVPNSSVMNDGYFSFGLSFELDVTGAQVSHELVSLFLISS